MNKSVKTVLIIISVVFISSFCFAQEKTERKKGWDEAGYTLALQKAKEQKSTDTEGLGYTLDEEETLKMAIEKAMSESAPPCEALKIAVDLKYQPYSVLKNIFSAKTGEVDLDQMCMCATEKGVKGDLFNQAAKDANLLDEATQAQCKGFGYTEEIVEFEIIPPPEKEDPISPASPGEVS